MTYAIQYRQPTLVITDPQRRVYNGVPFSSEVAWGAWSTLEEFPTTDKALNRVEFWVSLNDHAVRERGKMARREFRVVPVEAVQ